MCSGIEAGCEAAIHSVREAFDDSDTEAALLIDASNAFNSVKRETTIQNIASLCPSFYVFLVNTYRCPIRLFIPVWREEIMSLEGTTQGDPAAMGMYALSVVPLIKLSEKAESQVCQVWYADDGTGVGKLTQLKGWWDTLASKGPNYGYYTNARKTVLVVKPQHEAQAKGIFANTGIEIQTNGARHLGAAIGSKQFMDEYVQRKVQQWCTELETLTSFATTEPQAAYAAYAFGLKGKWNFLQRVLPNLADEFQPLEDLIRSNFLPKLTGRDLTKVEREILALPARDGGLGIPNPVTSAPDNYAHSRQVTQHLQKNIRAQKWECPDATSTEREKKQVIKEKRQKEKQNLTRVKKELKEEDARRPQGKTNQTSPLRALEAAAMKGASAWLTTLPLEEENRALNKAEFRDALSLRYGWRPKNLPQKCACGGDNSVAHCLDCKLGGYVVMRHNQLRNTFSRLLSRAGCKSVQLEQQLLPVEGELDHVKSVEQGDEARMDVTAVGFWGAWQRAFFDVRVFDPFAQSYAKKPISTIFQQQEKEKVQQENQRD